jgi:hypothetical protein
MSDQEKNQKELIHLAFAEFSKAISEAKQGRAPTSSFDKLKQVYNALSEAEKKRSNNEITDEELQKKMAEEVEKLKGGI